MSAMQAVEDRELLCFIERLRWRDSQQGQIMRAVREAIGGGDYGRIPALVTALAATEEE